jgi:hypothetical protein
MKNLKCEAADAYWKYLEENSKVVSTWPDWLKGNRAGTPPSAGEEQEQPKGEKLAS